MLAAELTYVAGAGVQDRAEPVAVIADVFAAINWTPRRADALMPTSCNISLPLADDLNSAFVLTHESEATMAPADAIAFADSYE